MVFTVHGIVPPSCCTNPIRCKNHDTTIACTSAVMTMQSILDVVHTAGKTERFELSVYVCVRCLTRAPNNLYGNISHMCKQCIPGPLPSFGRGLGTRLSHVLLAVLIEMNLLKHVQ